MPAPWSDYAVVVEHIFKVAPQATPTRSDFLDICNANADEISDDVVDGFDSLREGVMFNTADDVKAALQANGQIAG
ncbi:MAG: hypothetical protein O2798_05110 [Chloroflexi bacterium]|nr:hypothetical protein [Chloroflexota bacterium]MDA1240207.1 hypothetical protein [Chloroflexota bacterium]MQC47821.1 hypothetical protein [Chloroflexota bacterium]